MTTAITESTQERVVHLTGTLIAPLQRGYLADEPHAVAALARLRRGAGRTAGQVPDLWGLLDLDPLHEPPDDRTRPLSERELVRAENAVLLALTLWAFHQQSRGSAMHVPDSHKDPRGLGAATRRLMPPDDVTEPVRRRLVRAGTAPDLPTLAQRLRELVSLLRGEDVALDYALLAGQLYAWQWPGGAVPVRAAWGRSFHAFRHTKQKAAADDGQPAIPSP
ncbi:type I-E CRISPR-associated protein Cse2/CasB, partial [Streptomyces durbertensis]